MAVQFRASQDRLCKDMGFEISTECFVKGESNICILYDIGGLNEINGQQIEKDKDENFQMVFIFEMDPIKCELFDCD